VTTNNINIALPQLDLLIFDTKKGRSYGSNQQMYKIIWQRKSGCGPSTAANLIMYSAYCNRHAELNANLCMESNLPVTEDSMFFYMQKIWEYVTPGLGGVNKTSKFVKGVYRYALKRGLDLKLYAMDIPVDKKDTDVNLDSFLEFIRKGLECGCPVAFLNLCRGALTNLDSWHWVSIMALYEAKGTFYATLYDEGGKKDIDIKLWFETHTKDGGLVYFDPNLTEKITR